MSRNTPGRQSKEFTAKLHKVSFPNFKKLKESKEAKGNKSLSSSSIQMSEVKQDSPAPAKESSSSSAMSAPMKRASILKDKLINRNSSVPSNSSDTMDGGGVASVDSGKVSLKMKHISLDSGTSSVGGGSGGSGGSGGMLVLGSSNHNSNNSFDLTESSSDPLENNNSIATRPSILPLDLGEGSKGHTSNGSNGGAVTHNNNNNNNNNNVQVYQL